MRALLAAMPLAVLGALAAPAAADTPVSCARNAAPLADDLAIDGRLDDWDGVKPVRVGGTSADASFALRCLFDDDGVALAIDVRDDAVIRVRSGKASEDAVELRLGDGKPLLLRLMPGTATGAPRYTLGGKALPGWVQAGDSLQDKGFSVEVLVPWSKFPGFSAAAATLPAEVAFIDADQATGTLAAPLRHAGGLALAGASDLLADFFKAVGGRKSDVVLDELADVDPARAGKERVVAVRTRSGAAVGVLTDAFAYMTLPVASAADLRAAQLIDWRGDGTAVLATTVRQLGGGGSRDLLLLIGGRGGNLAPLHQVEIRKEHSGHVLASTWTLAKVGKGKKAKLELTITAGPATGWTADTFDEEPADDAVPIHLPWSAERFGAAYTLSATDELGERAVPPPKRR